MKEQIKNFPQNFLISVPPVGFGSWELLEPGFVGDLGANPAERREFSKTCKMFTKKIEKCIILAYLAKNSKSIALSSRPFGRKTQMAEIVFRTLSKICKRI